MKDINNILFIKLVVLDANKKSMGLMVSRI